MKVERNYRGVPLWVIRDYLIALGGTAESEMRVRGDGWIAVCCNDAPLTFDAIRFETVHIDFEGDAGVLQSILAAFDLKMTRPGG